MSGYKVKDYTRGTSYLIKLAMAEAAEIEATCDACMEVNTYMPVKREDFFREAKSHDLSCRYTHIDATSERCQSRTDTVYVDKASVLRSRAKEESGSIRRLLSMCPKTLSYRSPQSKDHFFSASPGMPLKCRYRYIEYNEDGQIANTHDYYHAVKDLLELVEEEAGQMEEIKGAFEQLKRVGVPYYRMPPSGAIFRSEFGRELYVRYYYEPQRVMSSPSIKSPGGSSFGQPDHLRRITFRMEGRLLVDWAKKQGAMAEQKAMSKSTPY